MAAQVFEDAWRLARLHFTGVPPLLVRDWVQDAYTRLCAYRGGGWAFLRKEAFISVLASRTVTVTYTQGSPTITSAALFVSTDAGRQIKTSTYPVYTIASVTDASTAVLDQSYAGTGGAISSTILDAYVTCPADFERFLIIVDPYNQRILPFWVSQDELGLTDPSRTVSDSGPRYLVSQGFSTATATLGQVRYEFSPYPTAARQYPYLYYKQAERFSETSTLPGVLNNRADLLKLGAQVSAAEWPGSADQKNPYYNLNLAARLEERWSLELQRLSLADDNQYPEDLMAVHWARRYFPLAPTTQYLRMTDATLADYVGG